MNLDLSQVAVFIAGLLWPIIYQLVRVHVAPALQGQLAHALAILFCYLLAAVFEAIALNTVDVGTVLAHGSEIAALSWVVYQQGIKPGETPTPVSQPTGGKP